MAPQAVSAPGPKAAGPPARAEPLPSARYVATADLNVYAASILDPSASSYTEEQAGAEAAELFEATESGLTGWTDSEQVVWRVLEGDGIGKSADDVETLRDVFNAHYEVDFDVVFTRNLGGYDLERAQLLLRGREQRVQADAVVVQAGLENGEAHETLQLFDGLEQHQRSDLAQASAERMGWDPQPGQSAEEFLFDQFGAPGEFHSADHVAWARVVLLPETDPHLQNDPLLAQNGVAVTAAAHSAAIQAHLALDGASDNEQALKDLFTSEQLGAPVAAILAADEQRYNAGGGSKDRSLRARIQNGIGGADRDLILHGLDPERDGDAAQQAAWRAKGSALRIHHDTSIGTLRAELAGKGPDEIAAIDDALNNLPAGADLRTRVRQELSDAEAGEILHLLDRAAPAPAELQTDAGGLTLLSTTATAEASSSTADADLEWEIEHSALSLHAALDGTDDEAHALDILRPYQKPQIDRIADEYFALTGENLRDRLGGSWWSSDLGGRDAFEALQLFDRGAIDFAGDPRAAIAEQIHRAREQQAYENGPSLTSSIVSSLLPQGHVVSRALQALDNVGPIGLGQKIFRADPGYESDGERLDRTLDEAEQALAEGELETAARYAGFSDSDMQTLIGTKNTTTEIAASGAAIIAATAATVVTVGAGAPLLAAAAAAGAAAGTASAGTYATLNPQVGLGEVAGNVAIDTAANATGIVAFGMVRSGGLGVRLAARPSFDSGVRGAAIEETWIGAQSGFVDGALSTATESETWANGIGAGLANVTLVGAFGAAGGAVLGGAAAAGLSALMARLGGRIAAPADSGLPAPRTEYKERAPFNQSESQAPGGAPRLFNPSVLVADDIGFITLSEYNRELRRLAADCQREGIPVRLKHYRKPDSRLQITILELGEGKNIHLQNSAVHGNEPIALWTDLYVLEYFRANPDQLREHDLRIMCACLDPDSLHANQPWVGKRHPDIHDYMDGNFRNVIAPTQAAWGFPLRAADYVFDRPPAGPRVLIARDEYLRSQGCRIVSLIPGHNAHLEPAHVYWKASGPGAEELVVPLEATATERDLSLITVAEDPFEVLLPNATAVYPIAEAEDFLTNYGVRVGKSDYNYLSTTNPALVGVFSEFADFVATEIAPGLRSLTLGQAQEISREVLGDLPEMKARAGRLIAALPSGAKKTLMAQGALSVTGQLEAMYRAPPPMPEPDPRRMLQSQEAFRIVGTGPFFQAAQVGMITRSMREHGLDPGLAHELYETQHAITDRLVALGKVEATRLADAVRVQIDTAMIALEHALTRSRH